MIETTNPHRRDDGYQNPFKKDGERVSNSLDGLVLFQHPGHRHDGKRGTIIEGDPSCCIIQFEDGTCFGPCGPNSGDNVVVLEENAKVNRTEEAKGKTHE